MMSVSNRFFKRVFAYDFTGYNRKSHKYNEGVVEIFDNKAYSMNIFKTFIKIITLKKKIK